MEPTPSDRSTTPAERSPWIVGTEQCKEETLKRSFLLLCFVFLALIIFYETCPSEQEAGIIRMKVMNVKRDPLGGSSVVILQDMDEKKAIPIWIGLNEANAIYREINGVVPPRPMTHDLIKNILEGLHASLQHVLIHDVRDNIIYARIVLSLNGKDIPIDARPSDAIAVALRTKAPVFVTDEIYRALSLDLKKGREKGSELSI